MFGHVGPSSNLSQISWSHAGSHCFVQDLPRQYVSQVLGTADQVDCLRSLLQDKCTDAETRGTGGRLSDAHAYILAIGEGVLVGDVIMRLVLKNLDRDVALSLAAWHSSLSKKHLSI